jgi:hypothetical protein
MSAERYSEYPEPVSHWSLWFGMLGGAGAWALHLVVSYSLVPAACAAGLGYLFYVGIAGCAGIALGALFFAWRGWNLTRDLPEDTRNGNGARLISNRVRFMAISGLALSAFFLMVILAQSVPVIMQDPCEAAGSLRI